MKVKMRVPKRILSLVLALVMLLGMMPMMSLTAHAAEPITLSGNTFIKNPGESFTFYSNFYCGGNCKTTVYLDSNIEGHSFEITSFSYQIGNGSISYTCGYKITGCEGTSTGSFSYNNTFDCSERYVSEGKTVTPSGFSSKCGVSVKWTRIASAHQGNATCKTAANCTLCGKSYSNASNHEQPNDFTYSISTSDNTKHDVKYACCNAVKETVAHTVEPAYTLNATDKTKHDKTYSCCNGVSETATHSNCTYFVSGNVITETCGTNCGHSKTATLQLKSGADLTYTGSAIEPMEIVYSEGWVGTQVQPDSNSYTDNVDVGRAVCTIDSYMGNVTMSFTITAKELTSDMVTLSPASDTYTGSAIAQPAVTVQDGTAMTASDYTVTWPADADWTNTGTITVTVTGKSNYTGTVTKDFTIGKATPTADDFTVTLPTDLTYNGKGKTATAEVKSGINGMGTVSVKYYDAQGGEVTSPTNAGTYTVKLDVAEGSNYNAASGIVLGNFTIAKADATASVSMEGWEYGDTAKAPVPVSTTNGTDAVTYQYKVKGADDSTYISTVPTAAGEYTVKATFAATGNYTEATATADFEIAKRKVTVTADNASKTYGGTDPELTWTVTSGTELASEPLSVNISRAEGENADEYTITFSQNDGANPNYDITFVDGTFTINKAALTVTAENKTATYGDAVPAYTVTYSGFVSGDDKNDLGGTLAFACDYEQFDDKGTYTITPSGLTSGNYDITFVPGTLTVGAKEITVTIAGKTSVYGDEIVELTADDHGGIVNNDTNVYSLATTASKTADTGKYDITGTALDGNYSITFVNEEDAYEITARELTVSVEVADKKYDGLNTATITSAVLNNVANEDAVALVNGTATFTSVDAANGISIAFTEFALSGEAEVLKNYTLTQPTGIQASITNNWTPTEYTVTTPNSNGWLNSDFVITAESGYKVSLTNTADGAWVDSLTYSEETDNGSVTLYLKNEADGTISLAVTESYKLDKTVPTGTVSIDDNEWRDLWNTLTFGLFFKETKTVKVVPEDTLSGIAKAEYYDSADALTTEQVKAITAWTDMGEDFSQNVTAEDAKTFIYYIRITDKAGNVTYISTADATYDLTAPAISGITDGSTYYTTQKVTVTDTNLETVTLNGEAASGEITLAGDVEKSYKIVATDKAGNVTEFTVTMKPIASISTPIDAITESNVNSGNADVIAEVEAAAAAVDTANATEEEKAAIKAITDKCDALQEVIADTAAEYERITDAIAAYDPEEVTSDDKAELDKLAEDLKALVESGNLTDSEKTALETPAETLNGMVETVTEVAAEADRIADAVGAYALETVKSSDKDEIEQLIKDIDALLATDNLTDEERTALTGEKTKCENLLAKIEGTDALVNKLTEDVGAYDEDTVKSTDKAALEQLLEDIEAVIEDNTNITEEEKAELEALADTVEDLLAKIEEVAQAPVTEDTEKVKDITNENVTPEDKEDLEKAKADLEDALTENAGNYTEDEKKAIQEEIDRIDDALKAIENVEAVEDAVSKLPAIDTVEPDDEDAIKAITDAKAEYDALTDHEKSLVDEDTKKKLDDLCAALVAYDIIKGENGKYTQGGSKGLSFTANGAYSKFSGILVDNKVVDPKHYTAESGSTVITLKASYLDTLSVGSHTLTVVYTDGETSCEFSVLAKSATPATGDNSHIMLWVSLMIVSCAAILVLLNYKRFFSYGGKYRK